MGTPNDVNTTTVDRIFRVFATTMAAAHNYEQEWPNKAVVMINAIARELKPFLKPFARPLNEQLKLTGPELGKGIVMRTSLAERDGPGDWAYLYSDSEPNGVPRYIVCYGEKGWVLVRKPDMEVIEASPETVASITGMSHGKFGSGGMSLFIDAWYYTVLELIRERRELLDEIEQNCLLGRMYEAFNKSKWPDNMKFIGNLAI